MEFSAEMDRLRERSLLRGVDCEWVEADEVEQPYRDLLCHERDMTSTLAKFHGGEIALEVLQECRDDEFYLREVLLSTNGKPVEYGLIEVHLEHLEGSLRERILAGHEPLGALLNESGLAYQSRPVGFVRLAGHDFAPEFFPSAGGNPLFGRYNTLLDTHQHVLARILEILPRERS